MPDHASAWSWPYRDLANPRRVSGGGAGVRAERRATPRAAQTISRPGGGAGCSIGMFFAASGRQALDRSITHTASTSPSPYAPDQPREHPPAAKKNLLKPWREVMWCIGKLTEEYRRRRYDVLEVYARPYREREPVICIDEKSKQLIRDSRASLPMKAGAPAKLDYEYVRKGTCNIFVAVEPRGGRPGVKGTETRTKSDFVSFVQRLLGRTYASPRKVHLVLDNLNTHFRRCFEEVLGPAAAAALLRRVVFHHTPQHAS